MKKHKSSVSQIESQKQLSLGKFVVDVFPGSVESSDSFLYNSSNVIMILEAECNCIRGHPLFGITLERIEISMENQFKKHICSVVS